MSWSLGEIRTLSVKAARGAGLDWGLAEEAGFAVEWLEAHGLPGTTVLAQYLSKVHRQSEFEYEHCPIKFGCLVSDTGDWTKLQNVSCQQPLLVVPFIASVLENRCVLLSWKANSVCIHNDGISVKNMKLISSTSETSTQDIKVETCDKTGVMLEEKTRIPQSAEAYVAILSALAHKTYAPATAASRIAGAGAGLNDND